MPPYPACSGECECRAMLAQIRDAVVGTVDGKPGLASWARGHQEWHDTEVREARELKVAAFSVMKPGFTVALSTILGAIALYAVQVFTGP